MNCNFAALIFTIIGVSILIAFPGLNGLFCLGVFGAFSFAFLILDLKGSEDSAKDARIADLEKRVETLEKKAGLI
jgi:hypothetical protein